MKLLHLVKSKGTGNSLFFVELSTEHPVTCSAGGHFVEINGQNMLLRIDMLY